MNNAVFGEIWENIELVNLSQQKKEKSYLVLEPNYHTRTFFIEDLLAIEMKKKFKY